MAKSREKKEIRSTWMMLVIIWGWVKNGWDEKFESEHDVDDFEFVHVYFRELIDMSSLEMN